MNWPWSLDQTLQMAGGLGPSFLQAHQSWLPQQAQSFLSQLQAPQQNPGFQWGNAQSLGQPQQPVSMAMQNANANANFLRPTDWVNGAGYGSAGGANPAGATPQLPTPNAMALQNANQNAAFMRSPTWTPGGNWGANGSWAGGANPGGWQAGGNWTNANANAAFNQPGGILGSMGRPFGSIRP